MSNRISSVETVKCKNDYLSEWSAGEYIGSIFDKFFSNNVTSMNADQRDWAHRLVELEVEITKYEANGNEAVFKILTKRTTIIDLESKLNVKMLCKVQLNYLRALEQCSWNEVISLYSDKEIIKEISDVLKTYHVGLLGGLATTFPQGVIGMKSMMEMVYPKTKSVENDMINSNNDQEILHILRPFTDETNETLPPFLDSIECMNNISNRFLALRKFLPPLYQKEVNNIEKVAKIKYNYTEESWNIVKKGLLKSFPFFDDQVKNIKNLMMTEYKSGTNVNDSYMDWLNKVSSLRNWFESNKHATTGMLSEEKFELLFFKNRFSVHGYDSQFAAASDISTTLIRIIEIENSNNLSKSIQDSHTIKRKLFITGKSCYNCKKKGHLYRNCPVKKKLKNQN